MDKARPAMGFSEYRRLDLCVFGLLCAVAQIAAFFSLRALHVAIPISLAPCVAMLACVRWRGHGVWVFGVLALSCFLTGGGSAAALLCDALPQLSLCIPFALAKPCEDTPAPGAAAARVACAYLCAALTKTLCVYAYAGDIAYAAEQATTLLFPWLFTTVVMLVLRTPKDLMCDMRRYLIKANEEEHER